MLFHKQFGLPDLTHEVGVRRLSYSSHAKDKARMRKIYLPRILSVTLDNIIEYDSDVDKIVVRVGYDEYRDIVLVIKGNLVITVWTNNKNDNHYTLDGSRYEGGSGHLA